MGSLDLNIGRLVVVYLLALAMSGPRSLHAQTGERVSQPAKAEQLFAMANETRAQQDRGRLEWDQALSDAALKHCMRMAAEGPISHRYGGEADVSARASEAGAHFSLIEENIAVGSFPSRIHQGWLESPGHRANLLNPEIDRIGVAVVAAQGVLFAVADYAKAVPVLTPPQLESRVAGLLRNKGVVIRRDTTDARAACRLDHGLPALIGSDSPQFVMRWQGADTDVLPPRLVETLSSGKYRQAAVGSCPARDTEGAFTVYRFAVLLY
jgi:Cysteine-rich secretory protein family